MREPRKPSPPAEAHERALPWVSVMAVSYTHLRAHETGRNLVCRLLLEKKKKKKNAKFSHYIEGNTNIKIKMTKITIL